MTKVASESLSALRTVQAYNAHEQERVKFHERIGGVLALAKKEATASAIFFGSTGWSGNVTLLSLLGYGSVRSLPSGSFLTRILQVGCWYLRAKSPSAI
jgi:ABC-type multidrug transport system fused ATPase/permease subunit